MTQGEIDFDRPSDAADVPLRKMYRATDPDTSRAAAADAKANSDAHRARALRALREALPDGLTDFELAAALGIQQTSIGKRRGELRDAGLVVDSGRKRPAPSGSAAIVWMAVEAETNG